MNVDGTAAPQELEYIESILRAADLDDDARGELRLRLAEPQQHPVDLDVFDEDSRIAAMMDLVALAHRDGTIHPAERVFLKQTARRLQFPEADLDALLA
jgi:uncharacterized tellurite resistance protein B-like protein